MKRKKDNLRGVTSELMADQQVRGLFVTTAKVLGWVVIGGLAVWGVSAVAKKVKKALDASKAQRELEEQTAINRSKLVNPPSFFTGAVGNLKSAMRTSDGYRDTYTNWGRSQYDKNKILAVLGALKNKYEWDELQLQFGRIDSHDLRDWLGLDNESDVKAYNLILSNMGVEEMSLIPNVELRFALWGLPQPIMQ